MTETNIFSAMFNVFKELTDGAAPTAGYVLNPGDPGLFASLDKISAGQASAAPLSGGGSIAAHTDHLRYGLGLLNRWSNGEEPFADANYSASWDRIEVSEEEWASRRKALRREAHAWRDTLQHPRELTDVELTGMLASVAHLAYHLGAIRQINRSLRGPAALD